MWGGAIWAKSGGGAGFEVREGAVPGCGVLSDGEIAKGEGGMSDVGRCKLRFELFCSVCGNRLQVDREWAGEKIMAGSAFEHGLDVGIRPCRFCVLASGHELRFMREAVERQAATEKAIGLEEEGK